MHVLYPGFPSYSGSWCFVSLAFCGHISCLEGFFFFCWRLVFPFMFFLHPDLRMQPSTGFVNTVDVLRMD